MLDTISRDSFNYFIGFLNTNKNNFKINVFSVLNRPVISN